MSAAEEQVLELAAWRVVFERRGDRFAHLLARRTAGQWTPLLASVEGDPDQPWPPSPPLQELHFESRSDGRRLALAVGMAGKGHWSLSIELDPDQDECRFEAACRTPVKPYWLGSSYQLIGARDSSNSDTSLVSWPDCELHLDGKSTGERSTSTDQLQIIPPPTSGPWPHTYQWSYWLRGTASSG